MSKASRKRKDALAAAHEQYAERRGRDVRNAQEDDDRQAAETDVKRAKDTAQSLRRRRWWESP